MGYREQFADEQWRALELAPFLVLSGVCGRYRDFGVEEMQVFERWLGAASRAPGNLNREVLGPVSADVPAYAEEYNHYDGTIISGLTTVGTILVSHPPIEVELFRDALINVLGAGIGRARGPYGKQSTPEGEQMLTMLDEFLRPGGAFPAEPGDAA